MSTPSPIVASPLPTVQAIDGLAPGNALATTPDSITRTRGPMLNPRRSDYDVTNTVQVSSPDAVRLAISQLFAEAWPRTPFHPLERSFARFEEMFSCLLYTSPSPRDRTRSRMPSSA